MNQKKGNVYACRVDQIPDRQSVCEVVRVEFDADMKRAPDDQAPFCIGDELSSCRMNKFSVVSCR